MVPDQEIFVHDRWSVQHFCMLVVAEISKQHGNKYCKECGAKKCLFCSSRPTPACHVSDRNEAVRREAVNKIKKLRDQYILNTEDEAFPEAEAFPVVEEDDEKPHVDEDFLIPTDDEAEEDTEAIEKTHGMPFKNIRKVILPKLKFHATNYHHMID